jgi:hypothetical protein
MRAPEPCADEGDPTLRLERLIRFWGVILWPSFLAACLLEALVFSMVDPGQLHWPGGIGTPSNRAIYTVGFFAFWLINMVCCRLVLWLAQPGWVQPGTELSDRPGG